MHEELGKPQVMAVVEDLVGREATGILEVSGSPSGAIYLDGGRIVFAKASWVPGLAARLRGLRPSPADLGELPSGQEADEAAVASLAVERGQLTMTALHELIQSIVVDAFLVLTVPTAMEAPVATIRFTSTRTYWTEMFPRLRIDLVRGESLKRAEQMVQHGLAPTTVVAPCALRAPAAVVTREQWAVACQIGDHASARDLAVRRGAALTDTLECLGSLTRAGLCTPVRISRHAQQAPPLPDQARAAGPPGAPPAARLPVRQPAWDFPVQPGGGGQGPTLEVLRQVLDGLRKFS